MTGLQAFLTLVEKAAKGCDALLGFGVGGEVFQCAVGAFQGGQFFEDANGGLTAKPAAIASRSHFVGIAFLLGEPW